MQVFSNVSLLILLFIIISLTLYIERDLSIFEPFVLFSLFYYTFLIYGIYLYFNNYEIKGYSTNFYSCKSDLFGKAFSYINIGYIFSYLGFTTLNSKLKVKLNHFNDIYSNSSFRFSIFFLFFIGVLNFIYNIKVIANWDILYFYQTISIRNIIDEQTSNTTIFYVFTYISLFLWTYFRIKQKSYNKFYYMSLIIVLFMLISTGRVYFTVSYFLSLLMFIKICKGNDLSLKKALPYIFLVPLILISLLVFYLFRLYGNLGLNNVDISFSNLFFNFFNTDMVSIFIIDNGNIPNLPVLMKIIDSWDADLPHLYGSSLVSWVFNFFPTIIRPINYQPSALIAQTTWFSGENGNHPPTGIGEMYANFSFIGPFLGMFLFGLFLGFLKKIAISKNNFFILIIYSQITFSFVFLYAKGEFDNLSLWNVIPTIVCYILLNFVNKLTNRKYNGNRNY